MTVFFGKHIHFKEVNVFHGQNISIELNAQALFQIDGEIVKTKTCTMKKQPFPLTVKGYFSVNE